MKRKTKNNISYITIVTILVLGAGYYFSNIKDNNMASELELEISRVEATVYKSPYCGCCVGWSNVAKKNGFEIATEQMQDRSSIKEKYNIPQQMQSCHTTIVGDYFVEGHVPLEVVKKLLEDKPDINGIALPNMQSGSPGMPGIKRGEFEIYQITDGVYSHYINY